MNAINQLSDYGTPLMDSKRMIFMGCNVFLLCLSVILYIVGMSAWSTDEETVLRTYWTYSESSSSNELVTMYGLRSIVTGNLNNDDTSGHVTYDDCDDLDSCENCREAGEAALAMCLISFFCLCPLVITTGLRIMKILDNKIVKLASIGLTVATLFWTIIGVWNWGGSCVDRLPIVAGTTGYKNGPGYNCIVCNIFWLFFCLYVHVSTTANIVADSGVSEPLTEDDDYVEAPDGEEEEPEKKNQV